MYKIVFAEDEAIIRESISQVIEWDKYDFHIVAMASDGEEALTAIRAHRPDLLITDIRMPFMDGLELCRQAKHLDPAIKIVIISGFMEFSYAQDAIKLGVQDYLVKPVTPMKLIQILTKLHAQLEEEGAHRRRIHSLIEDLRAAEKAGKSTLEGNLSTDDLHSLTALTAQLHEFLVSGSAEDATAYVERLYDAICPRAMASTLYRSHCLLKILSCCVSAVEDMQSDPREVLPLTADIPGFVARAADPAQAVAQLADCLRSVIGLRQLKMNSTAAIVDQAKAYIEANYASSDLTARQAADTVGLSANYFSNVFKQYTGVPFVKYLTNYRMSQAKLLLRTTDLSVAEISERVGYSNPNYFSNVFRRLANQTPMKYRER